MLQPKRFSRISVYLSSFFGIGTNCWFEAKQFAFVAKSNGQDSEADQDRNSYDGRISVGGHHVNDGGDDGGEGADVVVVVQDF